MAILGREFSRSIQSWAAGPLSPRITARGEHVVEAGRSVNDFSAPTAAADVPSSLMIRVTESQNVNIAAHSPGTTQSADLSQESRRQVLQVADALEETPGLLGLKEEPREEAVRIAGDLRDLSAETSLTVVPPGTARQSRHGRGVGHRKGGRDCRRGLGSAGTRCLRTRVAPSQQAKFPWPNHPRSPY